MLPEAVRIMLQRIAEACREGNRDLAAARLSWLTADVRATLGTRLDSSTIVTLNAWRLLGGQV